MDNEHKYPYQVLITDFVMTIAGRTCHTRVVTWAVICICKIAKISPRAGDRPSLFLLMTTFYLCGPGAGVLAGAVAALEWPPQQLRRAH